MTQMMMTTTSSILRTSTRSYGGCGNDDGGCGDADGDDDVVGDDDHFRFAA